MTSHPQPSRRRRLSKKIAPRKVKLQKQDVAIPQAKSPPLALDADDHSVAQADANLVLSPTVLNAVTAFNYSNMSFGLEVDHNAIVKDVAAKARAVVDGDLRGVDEMLVAQTVSLNAVFLEMMRRAGLNFGVNADIAEKYMRLGLKAQAQCRATLQTIAEMKNPRPVFVQQANFSNGPQQVNNAHLSNKIDGAREVKNLLPENKLLGDPVD